jgi:hypothetical protein
MVSIRYWIAVRVCPDFCKKSPKDLPYCLGHGYVHGSSRFGFNGLGVGRNPLRAR